MSTDSELAPVAAVVVLAAGGGTRMKSAKSKLLHEVAGKPMLSFAVSAAAALDPEHLVVVVGHLREQVEAQLEQLSAAVTTAAAVPANESGHERAARPALDWTIPQQPLTQPGATR